jgi:hypothetical protein
VSYWRDRAEQAIRTALAEAEAQGLDDKATVALVDSRYPFGKRERHPYQMWLKARRELVPALRAKRAERLRKETAKIKDAWADTTGQGKLPL